MIEVNPFSALSNLGSGSASTDRPTIADNFDTFLTLLTTQLRNQNPLDPLNTNEFTQQLVQFTEVEQTVKQNDNLEKLIQLSAANAITNVVGFLGGEVTLSGETAELKNGTAAWNYEIDGAADNATLTVLDANGVPVFTTSGPAPSGKSTFLWDGRTAAGTIAPDGKYTLSISALGSNGTALNVTTEIVGIVDGINFNGVEPVLLIGGREVKLEEIRSVKLPNKGLQSQPGV
ncbi:MAG: flagellar hook assembly protein FlgD [Methyloligellaceae bacterium]